jgi:hypothetical protein
MKIGIRKYIWNDNFAIFLQNATYFELIFQFCIQCFKGFLEMINDKNKNWNGKL